LLPAFLPLDKVESLTGKGAYCLYHGNLSVPENEKAVLWLLNNIFNHQNLPFIVAGKNPSAALIKEVANIKNVQLFKNPTEEKMEELIKNAHIHLLPSFNTTGIKMKLLIALFKGRFIITNSAALEGTHLESLCYKAETPTAFIQTIKDLLKVPFSENEINKRKSVLNKLYDNKKNGKRLMDMMIR